VRTVLLAALLAVITLAVSGCGGGHQKAAPAPWVQRANAVCKADDPRARQGAFDSEAMIVGLRREARDLTRAGFFKRVPAAGIDLAVGAALLLHAGAGDFNALRRADRALLRARQAAAKRGVHCSFAAVPLQNL